MILDFLKIAAETDTLKLLHTLEMIKSFKECESPQEYLLSPTTNWSKLDKMEDYIKIALMEPGVEDKVAIDYYKTLTGIDYVVSSTKS